jgi:hypothetical protein
MEETMTKKKISKGWLVAPILLALTVLLAPSLWPRHNKGKKLSFSTAMQEQMGQEASVRLDYTTPNQLQLIGDFDVYLTTGDEFSLWVSPFIASYADISHTTGLNASVRIKNPNTPIHVHLQETIRIQLPTALHKEFVLNHIGDGTIQASRIHLQQLTFKLIGDKRISIDQSSISGFKIDTMGDLILHAAASQIDLWTIKSTGDLTMDASGKGLVKLTGVGQARLNSHNFDGVFNADYSF